MGRYKHDNLGSSNPFFEDEVAIKRSSLRDRLHSDHDRNSGGGGGPVVKYSDWMADSSGYDDEAPLADNYSKVFDKS